MTTASHKYGLLQETVVEYEIVLGDGRLVRARRDNEFADLWHAFPWSHGSLGLLVGLTLRVVPVTSHVRLTYTALRGSQEEYCEAIRRASLAAEPADFVEATVFSRKDCVLMEASFVADSEVETEAAKVADSEVDRAQVNHLGWWWKPWFYTYVRDRVLATVAPGGGAPQTLVEYVPTYQYIMRHDRGIFWTLRDQLPERLGNHWLFRLCLGWLCPPKVTFLKLPATPRIRREMMCERIYQDIVLPLRTLEEAICLSDDLFGIWPILVYPSRVYDHGPTQQGQFPRPRDEDMVPGTKYAMYYDLGVYGIPKMAVGSGLRSAPEQARAQAQAVEGMRRMEKFTRDNQGAPFLYANTFMDREEFAATFDLRLYESVRDKYSCADDFPHLYDKTSGCQSVDFNEVLREGGRSSTGGARKKDL